jgi:hypothetical protein
MPGSQVIPDQSHTALNLIEGTNLGTVSGIQTSRIWRCCASKQLQMKELADEGMGMDSYLESRL